MKKNNLLNLCVLDLRKRDMRYQKKKSNFNNINATSYFHSHKHAHMQSKEGKKEEKSSE